MKKIIYFTLGLLLAVTGGIYAATLKSDITSKGVNAYISQSVTAQRLGDMIRDHETLTAATTLTYSDCGKTLFLNSATEFATTLPTPIANCHLVIYVKAAPVGSSYTVVTSGGSNIIYGEAVVAGAAVAAVTEDTITFTASAAAIGDYVTLDSDGTNWYVSGLGVTATAIAFTFT